MERRLSELKKSTEKFNPEKIDFNVEEPGFDSMPRIVEKSSRGGNSDSSSISKIKTLKMKSINSPKRELQLSSKPNFKKKELPKLPNSKSNMDIHVRENSDFLSEDSIKIQHHQKESLLLSKQSTIGNKNVRRNQADSDLDIPEAPVIHNKVLEPPIKERLTSIRKFHTGKPPFCCWIPKKRIMRDMIVKKKYHEDVTIDAYGIGIGLFFRFIKSAIYVLCLIFILNLIFLKEYSTDIEEERSLFPDIRSLEGKYDPFKFDGIFDGYLPNIGKMGGNVYKFLEFPIDDFGTKKITHRSTFNFEENPEFFIAFGLLRFREDSTLSFKHHDASCNKNSTVFDLIRSSCDKKKECAVEYSSSWFDSSCLNSKKDVKVYLKLKGTPQTKVFLFAEVEEPAFYTLFSIFLGTIFIILAIQPKILSIHEENIFHHRQIRKPEPRDFTLQIENLPQELTPKELKKRLLGHLMAKPEETDRVPERLMTIESERIEISNQSYPDFYAKNPILDFGKILNITVTSESEVYHNKSLTQKYDQLIQEKYKNLKDMVSGHCVLPNTFKSSEVEKIIKEKYIYACKINI